ncbi:hypothetical protein J6TS7_20060 [Paenibacillus dendritiformis]|nr:hypothetical protein J6TS7_20060 [Paenibacillus dendritiformis]
MRNHASCQSISGPRHIVSGREAALRELQALPAGWQPALSGVLPQALRGKASPSGAPRTRPWRHSPPEAALRRVTSAALPV